MGTVKSEVGGYTEQTAPFIQPHKQETNGVRSGDSTDLRIFVIIHSLKSGQLGGWL
jgi:hypothetical protein